VLLTLCILAAFLYTARDEVWSSVARQYDHLQDMVQVVIHAFDSVPTSAPSPPKILRNAVARLNMASCWEPVVSVCMIIAFAKLTIDMWDEDDSPTKRRNKAQSTIFASYPVLVLGETIGFVSSTSNFISLLIGLGQAITVQKRITLIINAFTYLQQVFLSARQHSQCAAVDEYRNSLPVRLHRQNEEPKTVRADEIRLGDTIHMGFGDLTPAVVRVVAVLTGVDDMEEEPKSASGGPSRRRAASRGLAKNSGAAGYRYERDGSGEDISCAFGAGDVLGPYMEMTRPQCVVKAEVTELVRTERAVRRSRPTFLDAPILITDALTVILIAALCFSIAVAATMVKMAPEGSPSPSPPPATATWDVMREFSFYFLAAVITMPSVIPGLKFVLLHVLFIMVLTAAYWQVTVQQYSALEDIQKLRTITFDKTGTVTDHLVFHVHEWYPLQGALEDLAHMVGWTVQELSCALTIANAELGVLNAAQLETIRRKHKARPPLGGPCGVDEDGVWGSSPEECEMIRFWMDDSALEVVSNPLRGETIGGAVEETGVAIFRVNKGPLRHIRIISRAPYTFQVGKRATVLLSGDTDVKLEVRQTGWSFLVDEQQAEIKAEMLSWAADDPRRAIGLAFRVCPDEDQSTASWSPVGAFTFENPVRPGVVDAVDFMRRKLGVGLGLLTGDAQEAAEAISRSAGICPEGHRIFRISEQEGRLHVSGTDQTGADNELDFRHLLAGDEWRTVSVEGAVLSKCLANPTGKQDVVDLLTHPRFNRVMFRVSEGVKMAVTTEARCKGMVMHIGDAANDGRAIAASDVGVCLRHGAEVSRSRAKLVIQTPQDLVDIMSDNGFADMLVVGSQRLFGDVCALSGYIAGLFILGVHDRQFGVMEDTRSGKPIPMFQDVWRDEHYWLMSNLYVLSAIPYATGSCTAAKAKGWLAATASSVFWLLTSLVVGCSVGWVIKNWSSTTDYGLVAIHSICLLYLVKHSWHCYRRHQRVDVMSAMEQKAVVGFGPQFRSKHASDMVCKFLSRLDSVMCRIVMYWVFTVFTFRDVSSVA